MTVVRGREPGDNPARTHKRAGEPTMPREFTRARFAISTAAILGLWCTTAPGQKRDAALVVDGNVREVFRSPRRDRVDYLVMIEVTRLQADRAPRTPVRSGIPAPGDIIYVHVT